MLRPATMSFSSSLAVKKIVGILASLIKSLNKLKPLPSGKVISKIINAILLFSYEFNIFFASFIVLALMIHNPAFLKE